MSKTNQNRFMTLMPGLFASAAIGLAAYGLSNHYGGPIMLFALLLGIAFNFLSQSKKVSAGIEFSVKPVLRLGVALLGFRMSLEAVYALGWKPVLLVIISVMATIAFGVIAARFIKRDASFGVLTGGAVAICGASAALAITAIFPKSDQKERDTLFTVIAVTAMSTLAMIFYPLLAGLLELDQVATGVFFGATIHDVAQVVGAGYGVSNETGDIATVIKLLRVAMLLPIILILSILFRMKVSEKTQSSLPIPWFVLGFALIVVINSTGWLPESVTSLFVFMSKVCITTAVAALGMKTSLGELVKIGPKPILLVVVETAFLAILVVFLLQMVG